VRHCHAERALVHDQLNEFGYFGRFRIKHYTQLAETKTQEGSTIARAPSRLWGPVTPREGKSKVRVILEGKGGRVAALMAAAGLRRATAGSKAIRRTVTGLAIATALCVPFGVLAATASPAGATACSASTGNASCAVSTSVTVTGGTLTLESSPNLYWDYVLNGFDQWASASSAGLTSCAATATGTTCGSGTAPRLEVIDATGSGSGWALSEYVTTTDLPAGSVLHFGGSGSATVGNSQDNPISTDPFAATTPGTVCDYGSTCTVATAASTCSHAALGFSSCPGYPVNVASGTSNTAQADLYSAAASTGLGAICFGSGPATAQGCTGTVADDFYNLGIRANTSANSYGTTVINLTVSSGP